MPVIELALFAVALGASVLVFRDARRAAAAYRLLVSGHYIEAKSVAERVERSWMRVFPSVRAANRYTVGCALHLLGDLEGSLAALEPLRGQQKSADLAYAIASIQAANLVLLGRDPPRALALLDEAAKVHRAPEDLLLAAHAHRSLGRIDEAMKLFDEAGLEGRAEHHAIFHYLRGQFLLELGRPEEARRDLEAAARAHRPSVYTERARALVAMPTDEVEGPSSLAPQVVAKEPGGGS